MFDSVCLQTLTSTATCNKNLFGWFNMCQVVCLEVIQFKSAIEGSIISLLISAGRVTLRETKQRHISTASTGTICLCLAPRAICVLIASLHLFAFLPPQVSLQETADGHALSFVHSFLSVISDLILICSITTIVQCKPMSCYTKREIKGEGNHFLGQCSACSPKD